MTRLLDQAALDREIEALIRVDPELAPLRTAVSPPLRRREPGLAGLLKIVVGQQVSVASAGAIWARFEAAFPAVEADLVAAAEIATWRAIGLSGPKIRTVLAVADAVRAGALPLADLVARGPEEAKAALTAVAGIGPWTAEVYLLFCLGHPDVFPAGDLALQVAVAQALALPARPDAKGLARIAAERWRPHRGAAAYLLWAHYRRVTGRAGIAPAPDAPAPDPAALP